MLDRNCHVKSELYSLKYEKYYLYFLVNCNLIEDLKLLFHLRWNVHALAALHQSGVGLRFVSLLNTLGINRDSLRSALLALRDMGLVIRNPGYGHPLRPEYVLTDRGHRVAAACQAYLEHSEGLGILGRKWSCPILLVILKASVRFNVIAADLNVTPRALTQALRGLEQMALVNRHIDEGYPPRTWYSLTGQGAQVAEQVLRIEQALSRT